MSVLKFIIGIISSFGVAEADGWFPVEKVPKAEEVATDIDPSIWVLFSKKLGSEQFSIRLPEDPVYREVEGGFILRALRGGEVFEVSVRNNSEGLAESDALFEHDGRWVHEHMVQTRDHEFRLRTYSSSPEAPSHSEFIASFSHSS